MCVFLLILLFLEIHLKNRSLYLNISLTCGDLFLLVLDVKEMFSDPELKMKCEITCLNLTE